MLPQTNATLLAVTGRGSSGDWDRPGVAGAAKWAGRARAYYRDSLDRVQQGETVNVLKRRELIVEAAVVRESGMDTDDLLTFRIDGQAGDVTARARVIPLRELAGIPSGLSSSRVILDAA